MRFCAEKTAGQFRLVQNRLLVKFKDRNPAPLKDLDSLLQVYLYVSALFAYVFIQMQICVHVFVCACFCACVRRKDFRYR